MPKTVITYCTAKMMPTTAIKQTTKKSQFENMDNNI